MIPRGATERRKYDLSLFCLTTVLRPIERLAAPHANAMAYEANLTANSGARAILEREDGGRSLRAWD